MEIDNPLKLLQNSSIAFEFPNIPEIADPYALVRLQVKKNSNATKIELSIDILPTDPGCNFENDLVVVNFVPAHTRNMLGDSIFKYDLMVTRQGKISYPYRGSFEVVGTITRDGDSFTPVEYQSILEKLASTVVGFGAWMIGVDAFYWSTILGAPNLVLARCLRWLNENKLSKLNPFAGQRLLKSGATDLDVLETGITIDTQNNITGVPSLSIVNAPTNADHATRRDWVESEMSVRIQAAINGLINGAPESADTFREIFEMLNSDPHFATTVFTALATKIPITEKGVANGVATLGQDGLVPSSQLPPSAASVTSVNGKIGIVILNNVDVSAAPSAGISPDAITETTAKQFISAGAKGLIDEFTIFSTLNRITPSPAKPFFDLAQDLSNSLDANWPQLGPFLRGLKWGVGDPLGVGTFVDTYQVTVATKYDSNSSVELTLSGSATASLLSMILDDLNYYAMFKSTDGITPATVNAALIDNYALVVRAVTDIGNGTGKIAAGTYMQLKFTNGSIVNTLNPSSLKIGVSYAGGTNPIGTISGATIEIYPYRRLVAGAYNATSFRWRPVFDSVLRNRDTVSPGFIGNGRILDFVQSHLHNYTDRYGGSSPIVVYTGIGGQYDFQIYQTSTTDSTSAPQNQSGFGPVRSGRKTQDRSLRVWMYLNAKEYTP
ncbi:hypothetical protein [Leptospira interrogans]|uniref:hypothetical protein n=1 Tax=Leptospira interrogans TaxID=173 RepID=UPI0002BA0EAF|nr:hypothetical protein [Leptospira interrogans]QOI36754.1 hypothetical protein LeptoLang_21420 [Leptospira interrogans serovar Icterohaemorrhagiae]